MGNWSKNIANSSQLQFLYFTYWSVIFKWFHRVLCYNLVLMQFILFSSLQNILDCVYIYSYTGLCCIKVSQCKMVHICSSLNNFIFSLLYLLVILNLGFLVFIFNLLIRRLYDLFVYSIWSGVTRADDISDQSIQYMSVDCNYLYVCSNFTLKNCLYLYRSCKSFLQELLQEWYQLLLLCAFCSLLFFLSNLPLIGIVVVESFLYWSF